MREVTSPGSEPVLKAGFSESEKCLDKIAEQSPYLRSTIRNRASELSSKSLIGVKVDKNTKTPVLSDAHVDNLRSLMSKARNKIGMIEDIERLLRESQDFDSIDEVTSFKSQNAEILPLIPSNRDKALKRLARFEAAASRHPESARTHRQTLVDISRFTMWRECYSILSHVMSDQ